MEQTTQDGPIFVDVRRGDESSVEEYLRDSSAAPPPAAQKRRVRCPECARFTAETEEKMLRHILRVHRGENPFQCSMCDYSTYNKCMFEEHVRIHQGIKPFKCPVCPYRSASKKNAKKHELVHREDNPLRCGRCGFVARHTRSYRCHQRKHAEEAAGGEVGRGKGALESREGGDCPKCKYAACNKRALARHMAEVHGETRRRLQGATFGCSVCGWSSRSRPRILLHLIHHPQEVDESEVDLTVLRRHGIVK
ncbi:unnamed protein product, partial [Iphiclides podalirius]